MLGLLPRLAASGQGGVLELKIVEHPNSSRALERSVPARVHLRDPAGEPIRAPGLPFFRDHFNCNGAVRLELELGEYRYEIERGPEYRRSAGTLSIESGRTLEHKVVLERWIDMASRGWWSGETHVHRALEEIPLLLRSEDLHVAPVLTQWNQNNLWRNRTLPEERVVLVEPSRAYHVLSAEDERQGGALFYHRLEAPLSFAGDGREFPSPVVHLQEALAQPDAWIEIEKPFWWDMPTWVATGKVRSIGLANNHMCRSQMYEDEAWGRPRDAARLPPPRGNGWYSQEIYERLLDCGLRLPPSAGSASGVLPNPVGYNRVYVHIEGEFSWRAWWDGLAAGRSFVTNGPMLLVEANGRLPGEVFRLNDGQSLTLRLDVRVDANDPIEALEVVRDGTVVERLETQSGWIRPLALRFTESGWFLVRAVADVKQTFRFASSAPFWVEVGGKRRIDPDDTRYFRDWIRERMERIESGAAEQLSGDRLEQVLAPHREALRFFEQLDQR